MQPLHNHLFFCLKRTVICKSELQWALLCGERLGAEGLLLFHVYAVKLKLEAVSRAGGKALGTWTVVQKPEHPVACCGLFARLSCRQWLFWHQNTDLWVLSPSSKSPGTRRCLPLAYLQPQVALHEDFPAPIPWDTLLHLAIGRQTWTEGFWRFLELK